MILLDILFCVHFIFCTSRRRERDNILILVVSAILVLHCHTSRYRVVTFWLDRDTDDVTSGQSFHEFLAWAEEEDPLVEMPRDLHLVLGLHD